MSEFEEFTRAASATTPQNGIQSNVKLNEIAVLGGGADALLLAALCLAQGAKVTLFSAYGAQLDALNNSSGITLRGDGPIGTYQVNTNSDTCIQTTAQIDRAVDDAQVIFLTGPVHKQRTYAMVLADHLKDGQILVLPQGRTMGALETLWHLRIGGCQADISVVEAQNLPYWIDEQGSVLHLSEANQSPASILPSGRSDVIRALKRYLPNLEHRDSVLASSFEDGSALIEIPALLMGGPGAIGGGVEIPTGGQALAENQTFAALIGPHHRRLIEALVKERQDVAKVFGVRNIGDANTLIERHAGSMRGKGSRRVPTGEAAISLIRDGVIGSLVPLLSGANLASIDVPNTRALIVLASTVLGADVAAAGRKLETIGIQARDVEHARRVIDHLATGFK